MSSLTQRSNRLLLIFFIGTIAMTLVMRWHGASLTKFPSSKAGIVSLELAKTKEQANTIINEWASFQSKPLLTHAIQNTWIDFVYLFFYSVFFFQLCYRVSLKQTGAMAIISRLLSIGALKAGLCDVVENAAMLSSLQHGATGTTAFLAWFFAVVKFSLLAVIVLWLLVSGAILLLKRTK